MISAYARASDIRNLAILVGENNLSWRERRYLRFAGEFERRFISQGGYYERRSFETTLDIAWDALSILPEDELTNVPSEVSRRYYRSPIFESVKDEGTQGRTAAPRS